MNEGVGFKVHGSGIRVPGLGWSLGLMARVQGIQGWDSRCSTIEWCFVGG